jgi:hypothetical protein
LFEQFPLHLGPQQYPLEHVAPPQSSFDAQRLASGHLTLQVPPQRFAGSLGEQQFMLMQMASLSHWSSVIHPCAGTPVAAAANPRPLAAAITIQLASMRRTTRRATVKSGVASDQRRLPRAVRISPIADRPER